MTHHDESPNPDSGDEGLGHKDKAEPRSDDDSE